MSTTLDVEPIIEFKLLLPSTLRVEPWPRHGGDRREGCTSCCHLESIIMSSRCHKSLLTSTDPALVQDLGWPQSKVTPDLLTPARETQPQVTSRVRSVNNWENKHYEQQYSWLQHFVMTQVQVCSHHLRCASNNVGFQHHQFSN